MKCPTILCGQQIIVDKTTNRVTIVNVLDEVGSFIYPFATPFAIYSKLIKEDDDIPSQDLILKIAMGDSILVRHPFQINFVDGLNHANALLNIEAILIPQAGDLLVTILDSEQNQLAAYTVKFKAMSATQSLPQQTEAPEN